jgi:hypothetical protein
MAVPRFSARAGAAAALCALALLCCSTAAASASNVLVLNGDASFNAALAAHDFLVVDFYAPVRLQRLRCTCGGAPHVVSDHSPSAACCMRASGANARARRWLHEALLRPSSCGQPRRRAGAKLTRRDCDPTCRLTRPSCFSPQWCAFCKKLEPEYATAADTLKVRAPRAALGPLRSLHPP